MENLMVEPIIALGRFSFEELYDFQFYSWWVWLFGWGQRIMTHGSEIIDPSGETNRVNNFSKS